MNVDIADARNTPVDRRQTRSIVQTITADAGFEHGSISIAVVDDAKITELHQQYLGIDGPTDVLSFVFSADPETALLDGEVVASWETARRCAPEYGWSEREELLLYLIHGCLHLVGYDDQDTDQIAAMRRAESDYLLRIGIVPETAKLRPGGGQ